MVTRETPSSALGGLYRFPGRSRRGEHASSGLSVTTCWRDRFVGPGMVFFASPLRSLRFMVFYRWLQKSKSLTAKIAKDAKKPEGESWDTTASRTS
jgi:hypothetical protein